MNELNLSLANDFPSIDEQAWRSLVEQSLKGAPFDKKINRQSEDGFEVKGLYSSTEEERARIDVSDQPWTLMQEHRDLGRDGANKAILDDLECGVNGLLLHVGDESVLNGPLEAALDGVLFDLIKISLKAPTQEQKTAERLLALAAKKSVNAEQLQLSVGADPIADSAISGEFTDDLDQQIVQLLPLCDTIGSSSRLFDVNAAAYHYAGATDGQEIAAALLTALVYLRAMEKRGLALEKAANLISFTFAVDAEFFASIAKLRAARQLWSSMLTACGVDAASVPMSITARSADRMFTRYDPWVNMLRGTAACFAGAVGGADAVTVMPYDFATAESSGFGRRIARNVQSILMEESSLDKVIDPAAGSGFLEALTTSLSEAVWRQFQAMEANGGIVQALKSGTLQKGIRTALGKRRAKVATRKRPITGVSEFPNIDDEISPNLAGTASSDMALKPSNLAADFEALRDRAQKLDDPSVYLATVGDLSSYTPRASFAKNFFEAGGIRAKQGDGFAESGAKVAVICGADTDYKESAVSLAQSLKDQGAEKIFLAGNPGELVSDYEKAGISGFIYLGLDVPAVLAPVLELLENAA